jgi:hypothetical protein
MPQRQGERVIRIDESAAEGADPQDRLSEAKPIAVMAAAPD